MEWIGTLAAIITTSAFLPQVIQVIKTKDTKSISLKMYFFLLIGLTLWVIYGLLTKNFPIIFANGITWIFSMIIFLYKLLE